MMGSLNIKMTVEVSRDEALSRLKGNRARHSELVKEARIGYVKQARVELEKRLKDLESGKVVSLSFSLAPPQDYTSAYDTVIDMLESHNQPTVTLSASEHRQLMQDKWDWRNHWAASNAGYSEGTRALMEEGAFEE